MVNKRLLLLGFFVALAVGTFVGDGLRVPSNYLSDPFFWAGFIVSFVIGYLVIMNINPNGIKSARIMKIGAVAWFLIIVSALLVPDRYPEALVFGSGAPGLFIGVGVRGFTYFLSNTRWGYCPSCKVTSWIERRNGKWYCMKRNDPIEGGPATTI